MTNPAAAYAGVICIVSSINGAPGCGPVDISEDEYDRQMSRPANGWVCPHCGGIAEFDDERFEELQGIA